MNLALRVARLLRHTSQMSAPLLLLSIESIMNLQLDAWRLGSGWSRCESERLAGFKMVAASRHMIGK